MRRAISILSILGIIAAAILFIFLATSTITAPAHLSLPALNSEVVQGEQESSEPTIPFEGFPLNEARFIEFEVDEETLDRLTHREQRDQMLDWLLYTAVSDAGLSVETINRGLFDLPAIRYGYMQPIANFEYGETRSVYIGDGKVVALVPADSSTDQRHDYLAHIADEHRKNLGEIPPTLLVFDYQLDPDAQFALLTRRQVFDTQELYTEDSGYHEVEIRSLGDLESFMEQVDDITFARVDGNSLKLAGRKIRSREYRGIRVEDVAAIWQAEKGIHTKLAQFEARWQKKLDELNARWKEKRFRPEELPEKERQYKEEVEQLQQAMFQERIDLGLVESSGFSLDPTYDYDGLMSFFEGIEPQLRLLASEDASPITMQDIEEAKNALAKHAEVRYPEVPFLNLADKLSKSEDSYTLLGGSISKGIKEYRFQAARYDGDLQGTEVGMVLFYTDLLAKLWALDYMGGTPDKYIEDFQAMTEVSISPIYEQEMKELPSTRLWFGHQDKGFQLADESCSLLFARNATRVYAASSDPLRPGVEVAPNAASAAFLGWWNDHYEEVARHEQEYERLNEIMKWSLLISWLNEAGKGDFLGFLGSVKVVERSNWFPQWVQEHPKLKFRQWDPIDFYDQGYKGTKTEAMTILYSELYELFGQRWTLSGGVSLAPKSLFEERKPLSKAINGLLRRSNLDYGSPGLGNQSLRTFGGIEYNFKNLAGNRASVTSIAKKFLFSVRLDFQTDLDKGRLSEGLRQEFKHHMIPLSPDVTITTQERGSRWQVTDHVTDRTYSIVKGAEALNIMEGAKLRGRYAELANHKFEKFERIVSQKPLSLSVETRTRGNYVGNLEISRTDNGFKVGWRSREIDAGQSLARRLSKSENPDRVLLEDPTVEAIFKLPGEHHYLVKGRGMERWMKIAPEEEPSAEIASGWRSRVADPEGASQNLLLTWMDEGVVRTELARQGYIVIESVEGTEKIIWKPAPLRAPLSKPLELISGNITIKGHFDPQTGAIYLHWEGLPKTLQDDLIDLQRLIRNSDLSDLEDIDQLDPDAPSISYSIPETRWNITRLVRDLENHVYERVAMDIVNAPQEFRIRLAQHLAEELKRSDGFLANDHFVKAIQHLNDLIAIYGPIPELTLRKRIAEIGRGRVQNASLLESLTSEMQDALLENREALRKLDARLHYGAYPQVQLLTISVGDESVHLLVTGEGGDAKVMEMENTLVDPLKKIGERIGADPTIHARFLMEGLTDAERELIKDELVRPLVKHLNPLIEEDRIILQDLKGKDFALVDLPDDPVVRTVVSYYLRGSPIVGVSAHSTARDVEAKLQTALDHRKLKVAFSLPWSKVEKLLEPERTNIIQQYRSDIESLRKKITTLGLGIEVVDLTDLSPEDAKEKLDELFREEDSLVLSFWEAITPGELEIGKGGRFTQEDVPEAPVLTPERLVAYIGCRSSVTGWPDITIKKQGVLSLAFWEEFSIGDALRFVDRLVDKLGENPEVAPQAIPLLLKMLQELELPGEIFIKAPSERAMG